MENDFDPIIDQQLLLEILDKLQVAVYITNKKSELCYFNSAAMRLEHLSKSKDTGRQVVDIWGSTNSIDVSDICLENTLRTGQIHEYENQEWYLKDGTKINAINSSYPIIKNGQLIGAFAFTESIKNLKQHLIKQGAFEQKKFGKPKKEFLKNGTSFIFDDIIGSSNEIKEVISFARRLAEKNMPILIQGETGTGKEMFAQSIHNSSSYSRGQFIAINCAAIPDSLLESILFGSVKGAFTGASNREGLFEKANGGTLFLDEINSMPLSLQSKILRAIQEKEIQRLGSNEVIKIKCRILSATNKNPQAAINQGELREDLYYRLSVGSIVIPPLRNRKDDIDELMDFYIAKMNNDMGLTLVGSTDTLLQMLKSYSWPGNIRELFNVIANTIIMIPENTAMLDIGHIPKFVLEAINKDFIKKDSPNTSDPTTQKWKQIDNLPLEGSINDMVDAYEEMLLLSALKTTRGNIAQTAKILRISRQALYVKIKKYNIDKEAMK